MGKDFQGAQEGENGQGQVENFLENSGFFLKKNNI